MEVGDLVRYDIITEVCPDIGLVIDILPTSVRRAGDNVLVMWASGKAWCCDEKWLEHLSSTQCKSIVQMV